MDITLTAQTATPRINRPGRVSFDFSILNTGTVMARDARLYEITRGDIRRLAVLPRAWRLGGVGWGVCACVSVGGSRVHHSDSHPASHRLCSLSPPTCPEPALPSPHPATLSSRAQSLGADEKGGR